ncbi:MAG TPA: glycoside hydrolase family 97 N-terminal domain-containing protein, partial [Prolixibacteraceae bacterium]|nr:glycoside hydrolase family 97 N-terminal domain-containing protein [Prolixibacteraceae bacterium]
MKIKQIVLVFVLLMSSTILSAQKSKSFELKSPDSKIVLKFEVGAKMLWSVQHDGQQLIAPSAISMELESGEVLGDNAKISSSKTEKVDQVIEAINYKKSTIPNQYNQLTVNCKNDYGVIFRLFNDGAAYRFFTKKKGEMIVKNEEANFNFTADHKAFIPYMWDYRDGKIFNTSFEALYKETNISNFAPDSLAFLPLLVDVGGNKKVAILEADLEDYPGMFLNINQSRKGFMGVYAPYPLEAVQVQRNLIPTKRADYIAKTSGSRSFPWRAIVISQQDKELLNNDMVQKLASPSRLTDVSWIQPGAVAWDWWNNWNVTHVDFKAGINTATYKYYIDFAAANKIRYIVMDEGWSVKNDLLKIVPDINLKEIVDYGKQKGIDVILWATWLDITRQMDQVFPLYSKMGIKGFKIDFFDRDD